MTTGTPPALRVDLWSDYVCPFSYLQLPVLEQLQSLYGTSIQWCWHAFELYPQPLPPPDPCAEHLRMTWVRAVLPMADKRQLRMKIPPVQPHSRKALQAAAFAREHGRFEAFNRAVFRAFFEQGQDIGQTRVLVQLAAHTGLDAQALQEALVQEHYEARVLADEHLAEQLGVRAVPALLLRRTDQPLAKAQVLNGTLPLQRLTQAFDALLG